MATTPNNPGRPKQVDDLQRTVRHLKGEVDELKRLSRGITRANTQTAQTAKALNGLTAKLDNIEQRLMMAKNFAGEELIERLKGEVQELGNRFTRYAADMDQVIAGLHAEGRENREAIGQLQDAPALDLVPARMGIAVKRAKVRFATNPKVWALALVMGVLMAFIYGLIVINVTAKGSDYRNPGLWVLAGIITFVFVSSFGDETKGEFLTDAQLVRGEPWQRPWKKNDSEEEPVFNPSIQGTEPPTEQLPALTSPQGTGAKD